MVLSIDGIKVGKTVVRKKVREVQHDNHGLVFFNEALQIFPFSVAGGLGHDKVISPALGRRNRSAEVVVGVGAATGAE